MKIVIFILSLFLVGTVNAEVLFEDNFDSQDDWTIQQDAQSTESCWSGCSTLDNWTGYYSGSSHCTTNDNNVGYNNLYLDQYAGYPEDTNACYGGSGKCITFWDESCTDAFEDSDGNLFVDLGQEYTELYLRFRIRLGYQTDNDIYEAESGESPQHKWYHVQHWSADDGPFNYFGQDQENQPASSGGLQMYSNNMWVYLGVRCWCDENDGETNCYYCQGNPTYDFEVGDDMDQESVGLLTTYITDENWHTIEYHFKMNTWSGSEWNADGEYHVYWDGVLVMSATDAVYSQCDSDDNPCADETNPPRGMRVAAIGGNNNNRWTNADCSSDASNCEQWYAIDDVVISTTYVGVDYQIGDSTTFNGISGSGFTIQ